jgi:hypothetical protein
MPQGVEHAELVIDSLAEDRPLVAILNEDDLWERSAVPIP